MPAEQINDNSLKRFQVYLKQRKPMMNTCYQQLVAQSLSRQKWDGCFRRNVVAVMQDTYADALAYLQMLPFETGTLAVDRGMSALTGQLISLFDGFVDEFLLFVVDTHRTSCALSNFPDEHKPSAAYINQVKHEIAGYWCEFALGANDYFLKCQ